MYKVEFTTAASREVRKLPHHVGSTVLAAIRALAQDPRPHGSTKLAGRENAWRIRVRDYRVIYEVHDSALVVTVVRVGNRRDVYR